MLLRSGKKLGTEPSRVNDTCSVTYTRPGNKNTAVQGHIGDDDSDVTIKVGDKEYKLHKSVLSDSSDYFVAMFSHDMAEKGNNWIELQEVDTKYFDVVLCYIYDGSFSLNEDIIEGVTRTAQYLQVNWILLKCCEFLSTHITVSNFQQVLHLIDAYSLDVLNSEDLCTNLLHCLGKNLVVLSQEPGFYKNLSFSLLLHFLKDNIPCTASEQDVLRMTIDWVKEMQGIRKKYMLELLKQIRFPLLTLEELDGLPANIQSYPDIQREVEEAREIAGSEKIRCLKGSDKSLPRGSRRAIMITDANFRQIDYYDLSNGHSHTEFPVVQIEVIGHVDGVVESLNCNFLFFLGCQIGSYYNIHRLHRYNPIHRTFTLLNGIGPQHQAHRSMVVCSTSSVFILHQYLSNSLSPREQVKVHVYDLDLEKWSILPDIPKHYSQHSPSICYHDNTLYMSGGTTFLALKLGTANWEVLPSMTHLRQSHFSCVIGDKLYVVGGRDLTNYWEEVVHECEVYDLVTGQWTDIVSLPADRWSQDAEVFNNNIVVLLRSPGTDRNYLYILDVEKNTLSEVKVFDRADPFLRMCSVSIPPMP